MAFSPNFDTKDPAGVAHSSRNTAKALTTTLVAVTAASGKTSAAIDFANCGSTGAISPNPIAIENAAASNTHTLDGNFSRLLIAPHSTTALK